MNSPRTKYIAQYVSLAIQTGIIIYLINNFFATTENRNIVFLIAGGFILLEFLIITYQYRKTQNTNPTNQTDTNTNTPNPFQILFSPSGSLQLLESFVTDEPETRKKILKNFYEIGKVKKQNRIDNETIDLETIDSNGTPHIYRLKLKDAKIVSLEQYK